jgi:hypothetical protein
MPSKDCSAWRHLFDLMFGAAACREYEAQGNGGQLVVVIARLDLAAPSARSSGAPIHHDAAGG